MGGGITGVGHPHHMMRIEWSGLHQQAQSLWTSTPPCAVHRTAFGREATCTVQLSVCWSGLILVGTWTCEIVRYSKTCQELSSECRMLSIIRFCGLYVLSTVWLHMDECRVCAVCSLTGWLFD